MVRQHFFLNTNTEKSSKNTNGPLSGISSQPSKNKPVNKERRKGQHPAKGEQWQHNAEGGRLQQGSFSLDTGCPGFIRLAQTQRSTHGNMTNFTWCVLLFLSYTEPCLQLGFQPLRYVNYWLPKSKGLNISYFMLHRSWVRHSHGHAPWGRASSHSECRQEPADHISCISEMLT